MRHPNAWTSVVLASLTLAVSPAAAQIGHMGQAVSEHVLLRDGAVSGRIGAAVACPVSASFNDRALYRVWPDGTRSPDVFTVPAGRQLVITDVEWTVSGLTTGSPLTAGATARLRLQISSGTIANTVFLSRSVEVGPERGSVSGSDQLTTGFVVGANTAICPGATEFGANIVRSAQLLEVVLRGYLIDRF